MIDLQKLYYFVGIVDSDLKLSKASKHLNISQPSLSMTIDYLEERFHEKLLVKEKNKFVRLTLAGEKLYKKSKDLLENANQMVIDIEDADYLSGHLSIAIPPVTQPIVTPKVIPQFKKKYPNIDVTIYEEGAFIGRNRLLEGELDFGFLTLFLSEDEFDSFVIYDSDLVCMLRNDHPLASKNVISTKDIAAYQLIGLNETFTLYKMIDVYFNNHGSKPNYFQTTSRWDYALEIVSNNPEYNFLTILPLPLSKIYNNDDMTYIKFFDKFKWQVNLSYNKNKLLRPECLLFIDFVKKFFNSSQDK
ncbi:LysR family transcriptional regulator [Mycoplasma sp. P36-A1]|uniref:LysR family transcriptional regulator n=1 Tax=Mycoplasma sp. P36-A1 TaxID=3252900 RepID=UPI003C2E14E9